MVVDCEAWELLSRCTHPNDDNAIYNAIKDIEWIKNYRFQKNAF